MAIEITTSPIDSDLKGRSKWWGCPELPDGIQFPCYNTVVDDKLDDGLEDTMTFICQINLRDIAELDKDNLLPHKGMLYFFARLDYFLGDLDDDTPSIGFWNDGDFRVIYSPVCEDLNTHTILWEDGSPAYKPAEAISFSETNDNAYGHKLLGYPYYEEVENEAPGMISLLQIDEDDGWRLHMYDMGNLNFLINPLDLKNLDFSKTKLYFHSL